MKVTNTTSNQHWMQQIWDWADANNLSADIIPRDADAFTQLTELDLDFLASTKVFPDGKTIESSPLDPMPAAITNLKNLKYLRLVGMRTLPKGFEQLDSLETLVILMPATLELPEVICRLKNLKTLMIFSRGLKKLPDNIGDLSTLENFDMRGTKVEYLPDSFGKLKQLKTLLLYANDDLQTLPDGVTNCKSLEEVRITGQSIKLSENIKQFLSQKLSAIETSIF